jgi:hypothetical protein
MTPEILDTYDAFEAFWRNAKAFPVRQQLDAWAAQYLAMWPDLLEELTSDYAEQGLDWRRVAAERVFPHLPERLARMAEARDNLREHLQPTLQKVRAVLGFDGEVRFVIYVGIGCGAGHVTTFRGTPAVLFGLENIAELHWSEAETIRGLIAHELGHVAHARWRSTAGLSDGEGPWWQLYEEGFAQRCEFLVQGTWHEASGSSTGDWHSWCGDHRAALAREFLSSLGDEERIRRFFGSWFEVWGRIQTGYYLGHEVIAALEAEADLRTIALLDDVETTCRPILEAIAEG